MTTQTHLESDRRGFGNTQILEKKIQVPLNNQTRVKTAILGGAGDRGYQELQPGTPAMGQSSGPRSKSTHTAHNTQGIFDPTHLHPPTLLPHPPKMGYPAKGGAVVSKSKKPLGDNFVSQMMILQKLDT